VITLADGLQYLVLTNGSGAMPAATDKVTVNYRGTLLDGTEFDSSYKRGQPASFPVGGVIPGWTEALQKMSVGSKWKLFIPAGLAYGEKGQRGIPPNSVLIFEVELISIAPATPVPAAAPAQPLTSDIIKVPSAEEMKKGAKIEVIKPEDAAKAQAAAPAQNAHRPRCQGRHQLCARRQKGRAERRQYLFHAHRPSAALSRSFQQRPVFPPVLRRSFRAGRRQSDANDYAPGTKPRFRDHHFPGRIHFDRQPCRGRHG
jgi:hypothetical protein